MLARKINLQDAHNDSLFLWGARQTGKSTLLKMMFPHTRYIDLLKSDEFERYNRRPALLREELELLPENELIIIDEIQKSPALLDEVHWLMSNRNLRFILSGSSARKLRRGGVNLLGGRAVRKHLYPFVSAEIPDFNLLKACNNGMLPRHYLVENAVNRLHAYVGDYLQQEIKAEALTRNLNIFSRFMEVAALSNGEIINYNNIATECGVSAPTVKEYFSILEETLIAYIIPAYTRNVKRRVIQSPKFYYFDVGIANFLLRRTAINPGSPEFGHAFEHLIMQEIIAYIGYFKPQLSLSYWRTSSGYEVDAIIGNAQVAIEIKSSEEVQSNHTKGLKAFSEEFPDARLVIVSMDKYPRRMNNVEIYPALQFLSMLWNTDFF
ncbi:ATP-binding protein [Petrimonas sp.]|uniref:ATP-binding protein n=1 Tax=Petrimonas sp. TaxID=2023866 RepID=UPI003F50ED9C